MILEALELDQINHISFVLVDVTLTEVPGLGGAFTLQVSKNGGGFVPSTGVKSEIGNGWYHYVLPAAECNTPGPLEIVAWGAGTIQQNLEYVVKTRAAGCVNFTYTVTNSITLLPIPNAEVWIATDAAFTHIIWHGHTDAFGVARDEDGNLPCLDPGTYRLKKSLTGFIDDDAPSDVEVAP